MKGSAGVMALVLAETVAGSLAFLWCTPLWGEVKRGFFTLSGVILCVVAFAAWRAAAAGAIAGDDAGAWSVRLALACMVVTLAWTGLQLLKANPAARVLGLLSVPVSIAVLVAMAGTGRQAPPLALFGLLAGAAFLGSVLDRAAARSLVPDGSRAQPNAHQPGDARSCWWPWRSRRWP